MSGKKPKKSDKKGKKDQWNTSDHNLKEKRDYRMRAPHEEKQKEKRKFP